MKTAIGIFLISSSLMIGAQTFVTAKVVTLTGDTLRGEAYYLSYSENKRLVEVKRKKFKKQINECLKENPALAAKYGEEEFETEKAIAILNEFNSWKASQN
jgi:hypothetical protein